MSSRRRPSPAIYVLCAEAMLKRMYLVRLACKAKTLATTSSGKTHKVQLSLACWPVVKRVRQPCLFNVCYGAMGIKIPRRGVIKVLMPLCLRASGGVSFWSRSMSPSFSNLSPSVAYRACEMSKSQMPALTRRANIAAQALAGTIVDVPTDQVRNIGGCTGVGAVCPSTMPCCARHCSASEYRQLWHGTADLSWSCHFRT